MHNCARCLITFFAICEILSFLSFTIISAVASSLISDLINLDKLMGAVDHHSRNLHYEHPTGYDAAGLDRQYFDPNSQDPNSQDPNTEKKANHLDFLFKAIRGYSVITLIVCITGIVGVTILQEHIIIMYMLKVCLFTLWHLFTLIDFLTVFANGSSNVVNFKHQIETKQPTKFEQYFHQTNEKVDDTYFYYPSLIIKITIPLALIFDVIQILLLFIIVRGLRRVKKIIARGETGED